MTINKSYEVRIRGRMPPQIYVLECFLEDLEGIINSSESGQINYTISPIVLQEAFKKKSPKPLNPNIFGRTIKVFLDMNGLKKDRDFTKVSGGGSSSKYHLGIKKEKAKELLNYLILERQ